MEVDGGARTTGRAHFFQRSDWLALFEPHLPLGAVALDGGDELFRERIDHAGADAMKSAGGFVTAVLELSAGMEHGKDHFEGAFLRRRMLIDRNAAAIVLDRNGRSIFMERDPDIGRITVHRLVDSVVENFPDEVLQSRGATSDDVHAGPFPDGLEPFENGDVFRGVVARCHVYNFALNPKY